MTNRGRVLATLSAVALTVAIAVAAVAAGGPLRTAAAQATGAGVTNAATAADAPPTFTDTLIFNDEAFDLAGFGFLGAPGAGGDPQARCQAFVTGLAGNLKVTTDQLQAALKQTALQQIDAAVAAGTLDATRAQSARDRINNASGDLCANLGGIATHIGGPGQGGLAGAGRGMAIGLMGGEIEGAAATYFGISADQFKQDLQSAGSLQAVAAKYGKDNDAGKTGLRTALENALRQSLTAKGVAADQITQAVTMFTQNFDRLYTAPLGKFGPGGMPGGRPGTTNPAAPNPSASPRGPRPSATPSAAPTN